MGCGTVRGVGASTACASGTLWNRFYVEFPLHAEVTVFVTDALLMVAENPVGFPVFANNSQLEDVNNPTIVKKCQSPCNCLDYGTVEKI